MRVVHDQQVASSSGERAADSDSEVLAVFVGPPVALGFLIRLEHNSRKYILVLRLGNLGPDLQSEVNRQIGGMAALDDAPAWEFSDVPRGKVNGSHFRLGVSRRHIDDEAFQFALGYALEGV